MRTLLCSAVVFAICLAARPVARGPGQAASAAWPQWGGVNRDFVVDSHGLANAWPSGGPKKLWSRALGEGHSAIALDSGRLYTMYRPLGMLSMVKRSEEEIVTAIDANTGKTIWEHKYASPTSGVDYSEGAGPHSTPLVTADRVYATGSRKELMALNKADGSLVWSHDLIKDYAATPPDRGY
ncbi:MAG TPA: PQQ-binding-like beta-propeller repeat protein, partial [Vicinamibacterales bacterium]|nr:PQQ-binding-like beta-propeller repeat protein [Vicinamibacterales bacterium]